MLVNSIVPSAAPWWSRFATVLATTAIFALAPAYAAQDKPQGDDSEADSAEGVHPLLLKSLASYLATNTFYEVSLIRLPQAWQRLAGKKSIGVRFWFERPNKFKVQTSEFEFVCDGKTVQLYSKKLHQYVRTTPPKALDYDWFRNGPFGRIQLLLPPSFYALTLTSDPAKLPDGAKYPELVSAVRRRKDRDCKIRKRPCAAFHLARLDRYPEIGELLVYIDTKHHRIWHAKMKKRGESSDKWVTLFQVRKVKRNGKIKPSTFKITRPERAVQVKRFQGLPGG